MAQVLPSEVVVMLREHYAELADHTAVGGERDLRALSGIVAATDSIPAELIPRNLASRLTAVMGTIKSAIRAWEVDSRRHHISGREVRELRTVLEQCPDERKWIDRQDYRGYVLIEPRPRTVDDIRSAMAQASAIMASCQGAGAPAYDQAQVIWNMLDADLRIELARNDSEKPTQLTNQAPQPDPALMDVLVPLKNRRAFDEDCPVLIEASASGGETLALVMFDIDHFKQVNDEHGGHETGDEALKEVAELAQGCVKGKGTAYRIGGDEFALVLPNHTTEEAVAVAERLRNAVNRAQLTSRALRLSLSMGVAASPPDGAEIVALKRAADAAAYEAKKLGRNKVCVARSSEGSEGAAVFKSSVELAISYTEVQIRSERHDYQLQLRIRNDSSNTIADYHVDLEMPSAVLEDLRSHVMYVADRSTRDVALFRATAQNHRESIYPGDDKLVMTVPYYVDQQLFWDRKDVFEQLVLATLYRTDQPPLAVTKRFKELQVF